MSNGSGIFKAAGLIAIVTVFSKFIGFLRDVIIAKYFGASLVSDAYFYAYQIPSIAMLILGGVGGPFHSATIAVFSKIIPSFSGKPPEKAVKLFRTFATLSFIIFVILGLFVFMFSDVIMGLIIHNDNTQLIGLSSQYLKIMSPVLIIGGIVGIYYGLLVAYNNFLLPNLSPILVSLVIIAALVANANHQTGWVLAAATTIGAFCQLLLQVPAVHKLGFKWKPDFSFMNNPELNQIGELLFPAVLSSSIGQIHIYIDMFFSSQLQEGAWTAIGFANRVFQFPLGVLVTAFLVPLFPLFAKLVAQNSFNEVKHYFDKGVGMLNFLGIPVILLIGLCGFDGVRLVFERGAFDSNATMMVTQALFYLSLGLIPYVFRDTITRVYYSFNDSKTPFLVAFCSIVAKVLFNWLFVSVFKLGIGGITFSTALVTLFNAVVLGIFIKKKINLNYKTYFANLFRICLVGLLCFATFYPISSFWQTTGFFALILKLATICTGYFALYFGLSILFKIEFAKMLADKILKKR